MKQEEFSLSKLIAGEREQRIFAKVFDKQTIETVHALATKDYLDKLEFVISTGKEAHVFRAVDAAGNFRAVKIYKIETSEFRNMNKYLEGDIRFKRVKKDKRSIVYAWARKEFRNLQEFRKAKVDVPMPLTFKNNVLVMEFIGSREGDAAPTLKQQPPENMQTAYEKIVRQVANMTFSAGLVHSDLSEFNILNNSGSLVFIDCGQAVPLTHPNAKELYERDLRNLAKYFGKKLPTVTYEGLYEDIKSLKGSV